VAEELKDLVQLKKKVEILKSDRDKAKGALDSALKQLKKEFDCDSLEDAEVLFKKLLRESEEAEKEFQRTYEKFMEKWGDKL